MSTSEKPRDVSGVELLMNNHQGHKAEIDAREDNFGDVYSLGKVRQPPGGPNVTRWRVN